MLLLVLLAVSVAGDLEPTTTRTYDLEVPGSDPIRIVEGEPLWSDNFHRNSEEKGDPLRQFLVKYAEAVKKQKEEKSQEVNDKGKSWDVMQYQRHKHPYDDKKGWVSMEAVPWSVSKISKWQSKYKPSTARPWEEYDSVEVGVRPSWNRPTTNRYDNYYDSKPQETRPSFNRPTAVYSQKVQVDYSGNRYHHQNHDENCNRHPQPLKPLYDNGEIITDGLEPDFPQPYEANRRYSATESHPETHPFTGEGEWVLLSTTKGYKYPQKRQRAIQVKPDSVGAHRGVRLTVLPPLKNSKVNMTTSHGGLLQVESTFQTVEQSQKQYTKRMKKKKNPNQNKAKPLKMVPVPTVTTKKNSGPDSSAVLAAVGAGMIPATMAMLVPMALGGRRKREVPTSTPKIRITLPRSLN